jgi:hypothetical protein
MQSAPASAQPSRRMGIAEAAAGTITGNTNVSSAAA